VWDTAGQERFRNITQTYYKGAAAIVLVYDCCDRRSFENVSSWMKQIETHASKDVIKVIVANKVDRDDREVTMQEGRELASEYSCNYFETSAKTGDGVSEVFNDVSSTL
jgi:small GTP-binding protein